MPHDEGHADELLARALLDAGDAAAVALKVDNLPLANALTVIFHGRRDLGTIQTYVAHGGLGAGSAVRANALLRVPVDLDLGQLPALRVAAGLVRGSGLRPGSHAAQPSAAGVLPAASEQ